MKRFIPFFLALLLLSLPIMALAQSNSYKYEKGMTPGEGDFLIFGVTIAIIFFGWFAWS